MIIYVHARECTQPWGEILTPRQTNRSMNMAKQEEKKQQQKHKHSRHIFSIIVSFKPLLSRVNCKKCYEEKKKEEEREAGVFHVSPVQGLQAVRQTDTHAKEAYFCPCDNWCHIWQKSCSVNRTPHSKNPYVSLGIWPAQVSLPCYAV